MRFIQGVIVSFVLAFVNAGAGQIGDFAPLSVGTSWVYEWHYSASSILDQYSYMKDSLQISITVSGAKPLQNDTLVFLSVKEQGTSITRNSATMKLDTTARNLAFIDTVLVNRDSIVPAPGYRGRIVPVWRSHYKSSDSVSLGTAGSLPVRFFSGKVNHRPYTGFFASDIGLYSLTYWNGSLHNPETITASLEKYNGKDFSPVPVRTLETSACQIRTNTIKRSLVIHGIQNRGSCGFDMRGKKLTGNNRTNVQAIIVKK
jgi:hypothetical protein